MWNYNTLINAIIRLYSFSAQFQRPSIRLLVLKNKVFVLYICNTSNTPFTPSNFMINETSVFDTHYHDL